MVTTMRLLIALLSALLLFVVAHPARAYDPTNWTQAHLSFPCASGAPATVSDGTSTLAAGSKITGPGVRDIEIENGVVKLTYELMAQYGQNPPSRELGAHMLYGRAGDPSEWRQAFMTTDAGEGVYGDWTFSSAPFSAGAVEAHVLTSNGDVVEVAFVLEHHLDAPGFYTSLGYVPHWCASPPCACYLEGCGIVERDSAGSPISLPPHCGSACFRRIRVVTLSKIVRIERCAPGYFVGVHTDPPAEPADAHDSAYGERELGTGWGNAVSWSSAGVDVHHPGQSQHAYLGIDDPPYAGGAEQTTGPWWVADLPYQNRPEEIPFIRYMVFEHRTEVGVWSFALGHTGATVAHFVNPELEPAGVAGRYQAFIGALPYVSNDEIACSIPGLPGTWRCFPNEPQPAATALVTANLPATWPN
jgi:hypothetical protein